MGSLPFATYDAPDPPAATPPAATPPTVYAKDPGYYASVAARNAAISGSNADLAAAEASFRDDLQAQWDDLQAQVRQLQPRLQGAYDAVGGHNAWADWIRRKTAPLDGDVAGAVAAYRAALERLLSVAVQDDDRCDTGAGCAPPAPAVAPAPPAPGAPVEYWFDAYFSRDPSSGAFSRKTGGYGALTSVPGSYAPGAGPTSDDGLNSAGVVYTPAIHAGLSQLVGDMRASQQAMDQLDRAIAGLHGDMDAATSLLADIERKKDAAVDAVLADPEANFKFGHATVDWLSYDGQLRVRLY